MICATYPSPKRMKLWSEETDSKYCLPNILCPQTNHWIPIHILIKDYWRWLESDDEFWWGLRRLPRPMINQGRGTGHRGEWCLKHPRSKDMSGFFLQRDFFYLFNFENEQNTCKPENFENRSAGRMVSKESQKSSPWWIFLILIELLYYQELEV